MTTKSTSAITKDEVPAEQLPHAESRAVKRVLMIDEDPV